MCLGVAIHPDVGTGAARLQEEGVAVVEEVHAACGQPVDGSHLSAQRGLHGLLEALGLVGHHALRLLERVAHGIVAAGPRVVERGLVAAQVDVDVLVGQALPEVYDVAHVGHRDDALLADGLADGGNQFVEVVVQLVHPSLVVALAGSQGIDFGRHAHHTGNVASLGLSTAHAAQTGGDEERRALVAGHRVQALGIEHGDGGAVDDALRTDVHIRAGRHLSVLRDAEGVVALPVVGLRVVGDDHAVGDHHARSVLVRGEEAERMAGVHDERLLVGHLREVLHHQPVLCPVLEHGTVAAVGDELVRMLCHARVEVVLYHHHDGGCLTALGADIRRWGGHTSRRWDDSGTYRCGRRSSAPRQTPVPAGRGVSWGNSAGRCAGPGASPRG